jgi:transmembrane sensor
MADYCNFEVEDFLEDEFFLDWVTHATPQGDAYWQNWQLGNPASLKNFLEAVQLVEAIQVKAIAVLKEEEIASMVQQINVRCRNSEPQSLLGLIQLTPFLLRMAAGLLLFTLAGFYYFFLKQKIEYPKQSKVAVSPLQWQKRINATSYPVLVQLSDHSSVILHPGGEIKFPVIFPGDKREVYLTGEAFFEVSKDATRPFMVYSGHMVTRVLGTSFLVKANKNAQEYEVLVKTGSVSVAASQQKYKSGKRKKTSEIHLRSNEKVLFDKKMDMLTKFPDSAQHTPVKIQANTFDFKETPLAEVVKQIAANYEVQFSYDEKLVGACPLTAKLKNLSLYEQLDLICKALEVSYEVKNGKILIIGRGCN